MPKVLIIAWREFSATVFTKGFLFGVLVTPLMLFAVAGAVAWMKHFQGPRVQGEVAVIDRSGVVGDHLRRRFGDAEEKREADEAAAQVGKAMQEKLGPAADQLPGMKENAPAEAARQMIAQGPQLSLTMLPASADPDAEKESVKRAAIRTANVPGEQTGPQRVALVVIPPAAVTPAESEYQPFQAFFAQKLDGEVESRIERRVADAIVEARLEGEPRLAGAGLSAQEIRKMVKPPPADSKTLTTAGEKASLGELTMFVPMGFMLLLMISVMTSGTNLLTTTVEEKSNRVMEVLLSAVSPMQLMTGKIVGQMGVGLLILTVYSGLGVGGLAFLLHRLDLISSASLAYLGVFFLIAYFLMASMMAAIGSAVNDMREAQALMSPVMVVMTLPWLIWFVIQRAPNSALATTLSFVPITNPFVMVIRLCGSEPVPAWQVPVSIGVGALSVVAAAWAAAKVFRVGVLMYGKPPNFATLVRWVRMA